MGLALKGATVSMTGLGEWADLIKTGLNKFIPDADVAAKAANEVADRIFDQVKQEIDAQKEIIVAEAKGESSLQRNWRPIVMLVFTGLIVAYWFGWTAPNLGEAERLAIFDLVKLGLGGYVIGRSVEKVSGSLAPALSAALKK